MGCCKRQEAHERALHRETVELIDDVDSGRISRLGCLPLTDPFLCQSTILLHLGFSIHELTSIYNAYGAED